MVQRVLRIYSIILILISLVVVATILRPLDLFARTERMTTPEFKNIFKEVVKNMRAENWVKAIEENKKILKRYSDDKEVLIISDLYLGLCYLRYQDHQQAIRAFQSCIKRSPTSEDYLDIITMAHYQIGNSYLGLGKYDEAIKVFKEVMKKYPDRDEAAGALTRIKESFKKKNEYDKFLQFSEKMAKTHPNTNVRRAALYEIAVYYKNQKNYPMAAAKYQEIIDKFPEDRLATVATENIKLMQERGQFETILKEKVEEVPPEKVGVKELTRQQLVRFIGIPFVALIAIIYLSILIVRWRKKKK